MKSDEREFTQYAIMSSHIDEQNKYILWLEHRIKELEKELNSVRENEEKMIKYIKEMSVNGWDTK